MPGSEVTHTFGEKYVVRRVLGHGGMGSVFEVENVLTGKRSAMKRLHPRLEALDDAESRSRVVHEARAMARIHHRNVVDVYDVFEDEGRVCLVMELLIGELLSARVARGDVTLHQYVSWLLAAMRGVAAGHAAGVIHRDIKPENIFLARDASDAEPVPVVIDFGVSKLHALDGDPRPRETSQSGMAMGTPRYVSYEQLRGARDVDGRTDVYAFGVMLYEAIAGRPPYVADSFPEQAIRFLTSSPPELRALRPSVPVELAALVHSAIARERERRPASMQAFVEELARFGERSAYALSLEAFVASPGTPNTLRTVPPALVDGGLAVQFAPASLPSRSRSLRAASGLALAGMLGVGLALFYGGGQRTASRTLPEVALAASRSSAVAAAAGHGQAERHADALPASVAAAEPAPPPAAPLRQRRTALLARSREALSTPPSRAADEGASPVSTDAQREASETVPAPGDAQEPGAAAQAGFARRFAARAGPMQRSEF